MRLRERGKTDSTALLLCNLDCLTDRIIAYRFVRIIEMVGLTTKLQQASAGVAAQQKAIEARADAIIARTTALAPVIDSAFAPHEALLAEAEQALPQMEHALATLTNGGPPLEPSSPSPPPIVPGSNRTLMGGGV